MNRALTQFRYSLEKKVVDIFVLADGGGAGQTMALLNSAAAAAGTGGFKGVKSITRSADGVYVITLQGKFNRLLSARAAVLAKDGSTAPVANYFYVKAVDPAAGTIEIVTYLAAIGTPVAPATNDRWHIELTVSDSTAQ